MSLHNEIMTLGIAYIGHGISASYARGFNDAKQRAAQLAIKADAEIASLTGENAVLRDLLRDSLPIIESVGDGDRQWSVAERIEPLIKAAIYGHQDGGLFDGYERAIAQAERNAAEAAYFDSDEHKYGPRPNQRPTFRAGFNAGWDRRDAVGVNRSAEIARLTAEIDRLQRTIDSRPVVNAGNGLDKLLPCPFCGGRAEMDTMTPFTSIFTGMSETGISAYCTDCSAEIMVCRPDVPDVTEEMVAEMWNTRAPRTCLACCPDGRLKIYTNNCCIPL